MRVFVTGAGRCGSVTFAEACKAANLRNAFGPMTAAHESRRGDNPPWEYPDQHIEVDPRLTWHVPMLLERYPDAAWAVLDRDRDRMGLSWSRRPATMAAWRRLSTYDASEVFAGAQHYIEFVYAVLDTLLWPPHSLTGPRLHLVTPVSLEEASAFFDTFGLLGDFDAFTAKLTETHNASA